MAQPKRLTRSRTDRILSGVAGGLAAYFSIDSTIVRIAFVLLAFVWGGGIFLYLLLWVIVPLEGTSERQPDLGRRVRQAADEAKQTVRKVRDELRK